MSSDKCRTCEHARQAGKRNQVEVVGCVVQTREDFACMSYRGGSIYEGWFYNNRRPGDERVGEPGQWLGAMTRGVLVDSKGRCGSFKRAECIIETKSETDNE